MQARVADAEPGERRRVGERRENPEQEGAEEGQGEGPRPEKGVHVDGDEPQGEEGEGRVPEGGLSC